MMRKQPDVTSARPTHFLRHIVTRLISMIWEVCQLFDRIHTPECLSQNSAPQQTGIARAPAPPKLDVGWLLMPVIRLLSLLMTWGVRLAYRFSSKDDQPWSAARVRS
jgi:hypothetical protein